MRVIVCGGRDYGDKQRLSDELDHIHATRGIMLLIEGGAPGADSLARWWAITRGVQYTTFSADWERYGKSAGLMRNSKMIHDGKPELVIAFPGGVGTANMISQANRNGIPVRLVR